MKTILFFCCLFYLTKIGTANFEKMMEMVKQCKDEHLTDEEYKAMQEGTTPTSEKGKCFFECMAKKSNTMKDGKMDKELTKAHFELALQMFKDNPDVQQKIKNLQGEVFDKCFSPDLQTGSSCENALKVSVCMRGIMKEKMGA